MKNIDILEKINNKSELFFVLGNEGTGKRSLIESLISDDDTLDILDAFFYEKQISGDIIFTNWENMKDNSFIFSGKLEYKQLEDFKDTDYLFNCIYFNFNKDNRKLLQEERIIKYINIMQNILDPKILFFLKEVESFEYFEALYWDAKSQSEIFPEIIFEDKFKELLIKDDFYNRLNNELAKILFEEYSEKIENFKNELINNNYFIKDITNGIIFYFCIQDKFFLKNNDLLDKILENKDFEFSFYIFKNNIDFKFACLQYKNTIINSYKFKIIQGNDISQITDKIKFYNCQNIIQLKQINNVEYFPTELLPEVNNFYIIYSNIDILFNDLVMANTSINKFGIEDNNESISKKENLILIKNILNSYSGENIYFAALNLYRFAKFKKIIDFFNDNHITYPEVINNILDNIIIKKRIKYKRKEEKKFDSYINKFNKINKISILYETLIKITYKNNLFFKEERKIIEEHWEKYGQWLYSDDEENIIFREIRNIISNLISSLSDNNFIIDDYFKWLNKNQIAGRYFCIYLFTIYKKYRKENYWKYIQYIYFNKPNLEGNTVGINKELIKIMNILWNRYIDECTIEIID